MKAEQKTINIYFAMNSKIFSLCKLLYELNTSFFFMNENKKNKNKSLCML